MFKPNNNEVYINKYQIAKAMMYACIMIPIVINSIKIPYIIQQNEWFIVMI